MEASREMTLEEFVNNQLPEGHRARKEMNLYIKTLEGIVKKVPEKVSREEAADMACEFKIKAQEALEYRTVGL